MAAIKFPPGTMWWRGGIGLPGFSSAPAEFSPLDLSPALWIDPSDASTVTISGSSGAYIGASGLVLPGSGTNNATSPSPSPSITDDVDVIAYCTPTSWTPGAINAIANRSAVSAGWSFYLNTSGTLGFTIPSVADYASTVATGLSGSKWVRVTRVRSSGIITFYTSTDGSSWTQLGSTVAGSTAAMPSTTNPTLVGITTSNTLPFNGTIHRVVVKNGVAGTTVFDADFEAATPFVSAFTESALGAPVYVVSSTATSSTANYSYIGPEGLVQPGSGDNRASTPDSAALDITGDIDIIARVRYPYAAAPSGQQAIIVDKFATAGQRSYSFSLGSNGQLLLEWSTNGTDTPFFYDNVGAGLTAGTAYWLRVTLDVDNGSGQNVCTFYKADDSDTVPSSWTTINTRTGAGTTSIFAGTQDLRIGSRASGSVMMMGTVKRAIIKNGIGGTTVFDADFTTAADYAASFTESSSNAATVTITATNTPANAAGALVSQINDKSGNARHLTQGTAANMPKYWNGRNGLNCLVFDGTSDHIGAINWTGLTNNVFTAAYVRVNDTAGSKIIATFGADLYAMWSSSSELLASYITAGGVTSVGTMNRVIGSSCMTDASASAGRAWLDGTLTTGTTNSAAMGGTLRLGQSGSSTLWFSGEIGELFICTSIPTSNQITDTHDYIKAAWGTP